jgi:sugar lactone lactonase YvrE
MLFGANSSASAEIITTVAGTSDIAGRPALSVSIRPWGLATASDGTVYVANAEHSNVLRFDPVAQTFSVVAGTASAGDAGDGGPATSAQLGYPVGLALDAAGNLFIADPANAKIRKVTAATGEISTVAGGGWSTLDGELATAAMLQGPWSVTLGPDGSIYIVEQDANRIRRVDAVTGHIYTIAGTGMMGYSGDEGPATQAQLGRPSDVAVDSLGNVFIADQFNHRVRVIEAATGIIRTYAGTGQDTWSPNGLPAVETALSWPTTLRFDALDNLIVAEQGTGQLRKIESGTTLVSTVPMSGSIQMPQGLTLAADGDLYVSSQNSYDIHRISGTTAAVEVVAGNGWANFSGNGGSALEAQMWPQKTVANAVGDLFIIDNSVLRKVDAVTGIISTYAGNGPCCAQGDGGPASNARLSYPGALTIDGSGNLFLGDQGAHRIRKIDPTTGIISHYAGNGFGSGGDGGLAVNAQTREIRDLATDPAGNLYVIENGGPRIRKITAATGIINSIAGNGSFSGPWGDGLPASQVALYQIDAIALDAQSNIYILHQSRIRRIDAATGIITTIAGTGAYADSGDGGPATNAAIMGWDIQLDAAGNIFIASLFNNKVRRIDATTGIIDTLAGTGVAGHSGDGGEATLATLNAPGHMAFDVAGNLYITEQKHIRRVTGIGEAASGGDSSAPVIAANIAGAQGINGWYRSDVTLNWSVSDAESDITSSSGCETTSVTADTSGLSFTCTATSDGGTASQTFTIKRDTVAPTLSFGGRTPSPNASGWNKTNVSFTFTTADPLSGVASTSSPSPVVIDVEGSNMTRTVTVTDQAGNSAAFTTPLVSIDKTLPTITISAPTSGASYVVGSTVRASYFCVDAFSGLNSCNGTVLHNFPIDTTTAGSKFFSVTATDWAGNVATTQFSYTVTSGSSTPTYCSSRGNTASYEWIRTVQIGVFTNTSNNNGGYGNFTSNPVTVARGVNTIRLTPGFSSGGYSENWRVWIDLNRDGTFGSGELLFSGTGSSVLNGSVNIPSATLSGVTRMRVSMSWGSAASPCGNFSYGEVEDYTVSIP